MLTNGLFLLGVALLFVHEMDAIYHQEWRIFAFLRPFTDRTAYLIFTALHIPLFAWFLWMIAYPARWFELAVDLFLIVHVGLHWLFRDHPAYTFSGWFSHGVIGAAGVVGAAHAALLVWG